jgi:hypothetical protein
LFSKRRIGAYAIFILGREKFQILLEYIHFFLRLEVSVQYRGLRKGRHLGEFIFLYFVTLFLHLFLPIQQIEHKKFGQPQFFAFE